MYQWEYQQPQPNREHPSSSGPSPRQSGRIRATGECGYVDTLAHQRVVVVRKRSHYRPLHQCSRSARRCYQTCCQHGDVAPWPCGFVPGSLLANEQWHSNNATLMKQGDSEMNRRRAGSGIGILALGIAMALSSVSVASAGQYQAKHENAKPKAAGSNGARSVAAALVADFESGKFSKICSLALPSARSACNSEVRGELEGAHPSFPKFD